MKIITITWPIAVVLCIAIAALTVLLKTHVITNEQLASAFPYILGAFALSPAAAKFGFNGSKTGQTMPPPSDKK